jgi:DNA-binding transcriptional MerR regulator
LFEKFFFRSFIKTIQTKNQNKINASMDEEEPKIEKLFFTIGEVAEQFKVNTSLIRYWEKEFTILKPKKNKKGNRLFTQKDIDNLHLIYHYVKERGMTLSGAKLKMKDNREDTVNNFEAVKKLKDIRQQLLEIKDAM